jgi:hypothetical protein
MERDERDPDQPEQVTDPRKPYERPAVVSEEVFETLALACGKVAGRGAVFACRVSNRS